METRIRDESSDLIVVANREVEKKWMQEVGADGDGGEATIGDGE